MMESKGIRLDPKDVKIVMEVGGPSTLNTSLQKTKKSININLMEIN